jgi:hypothetical protein
MTRRPNGASLPGHIVRLFVWFSVLVLLVLGSIHTEKSHNALQIESATHLLPAVLADWCACLAIPRIKLIDNSGDDSTYANQRSTSAPDEFS